MWLQKIKRLQLHRVVLLLFVTEILGVSCLRAFLWLGNNQHEMHFLEYSLLQLLRSLRKTFFKALLAAIFSFQGYKSVNLTGVNKRVNPFIVFTFQEKILSTRLLKPLKLLRSSKKPSSRSYLLLFFPSRI